MAIALTPEEVKAFAPEFAAVEDSEVQSYIDIAQEFICESKWGEVKAKKALMLLTCHFLKDMGLGAGGSSSASGPVTMEKVGDLQRSYGSATLSKGSTSEQLFLTTKYGRAYILLRKTLVITPIIT